MCMRTRGCDVDLGQQATDYLDECVHAPQWLPGSPSWKDWQHDPQDAWKRQKYKDHRRRFTPSSVQVKVLSYQLLDTTRWIKRTVEESGWLSGCLRTNWLPWTRCTRNSLRRKGCTILQRELKSNWTTSWQTRNTTPGAETPRRTTQSTWEAITVVLWQNLRSR